MSKNLVKVNKFYGHPYYVESDTKNIYIIEKLTPEVGVYHISGPAIDRLYEFEQLGMEPEEIKELNIEINALKDQITNKKDVEIKALKRQIDELEEENYKLKKENNNLHAEIEEDNRISQLKNRDIILKAREIQRLGEDIKMLEEANESIKISVKKLTNKNVDLKINLDAAYKGLEKKNKTIDNLKIQLDAAYDDNRKLIDQSARDGNDLRELSEKLGERDKKINELKEGLRQKSLFITATPNPYLDLGITLHESNEVRKLVDENEKLKTKLKKAQDHIVKWKQTVERTRSELNRELSSFELRNEDLMKMNDELEEKNKNLSDQLDVLRQMHRISMMSIYGAQPDQVENMKDQIERLNKNNAERQKTIDDLTVRLYAARSANDILRSERDELKKRIEGLKDVRFVLDNENNDLRSDVASLKVQNAELIRDNEKLVNDLRKNLESEVKDLKAKLETINNLSDLRTGKLDDIVTAGPRH